MERVYTCTAYTGDSAQASEYIDLGTRELVTPPVDLGQLRAEATRRTSRALAVAVLPLLRS